MVFTVVALGSVAAITLLLGYIAISSLQGSLEAEKADRLQAASYTVRHLDETLGIALSNLKTTARLDEFSFPLRNPVEQRRILIHTFQVQTFFRTVALVDMHKNIALTYPPANPVSPAMLRGNWLEDALAGAGPQVSEMPFVDTEGRPLLGMASALMDENGVTAGALVGFMDLSHPHLQSDMRDVVVGQTGYSVLVASDGTIVASSDPHRVLRKSHLSDSLAVLLQRGQPVLVAYPDEDQPSGQEVVAMAPLSRTPMLFAIEQDEGEFLAPLISLRYRFIVGGLALVALVLLVTVAISRVLARPLQRLARAASLIALGDLETRVPTGGFKEISDLGLAFEGIQRQVNHRTRELATVYSLATVVGQSRDMDTVLGQALDRITQALHFEPRGGIFLVDAQRQELVLKAQRGLTPDFAQQEERLKVGECLCGLVAQTGMPLFSADSSHDDRHTRMTSAPPHSHVIVPLKAGDDVEGVMFLYPHPEYQPSAADWHLLTSIGGTVGIALANARLYEKSLHRQEDLEHLNRLSQVLSVSLDLDTVIGMALDEIAGTFGGLTATIGIALLDEWGQQITVSAARGPAKEAATGISLSLPALPEEMTRPVFQEVRPWVLADASQAPEALRNLPGYGELRSAVAIPLSVGEKVSGVLFVGTKEPWVPDPEELSLLETYTREIALAVANARLYTVTDAALRHRVTELEALTGVATAAAQSLDLDAILSDVLNWAAGALNVDRAGIMLLDESGEKATVRAAYERDSDTPHGLGLILDIHTSPLLQKVFHDGDPLLIEDTQALPDDGQRGMALQWGARSVLLVPLMVGGRTLGTLQFTTTTAPRTYAREEVSLAQTMAGHLASVVENIRMHQRTETERGTLESIIASMGEGLVVIDGQLNVAYCNPAAEVTLNVRAEDVIGQSLEVFQRAWMGRVTDLGKVSQRWAEAMKSVEAPPQVEFEILSGARKRTVEAVLFPVGQQDDRIGTGVLLRDVTREREVDRMKTEFISLASHELRTPMTVIYGFAELLLKSQELPEEQQEWLGRIYQESKRLSNIVDDLLDVSRIEMGRLALDLKEIPIEPLITDLIPQLRPNYPSHTFRADIPRDFPKVHADTAKFIQVVYNLLDNAAKYSPQGGPVTISASIEKDSGLAVIAVADRGMGIPEDEVPHLFTRFHRIHRPETEGVRGTGLGLYIVKSLVEMMGGRVWAKSKVDQGSTFYIALPQASDDPEEDA